MSKMKTLTLDNGEKRETFDIGGDSVIKLHLEDGKIDFVKLIAEEEFSFGENGQYSVDRLYELDSDTPIQFMGIKEGLGTVEPSVLYSTTAKKLFVKVTAYHDSNTYIKCTVLSTTERHVSGKFIPNSLVQIEHWLDFGLNYYVSKVYEYATKEDVEKIVKECLKEEEYLKSGVYEISMKDFNLVGGLNTDTQVGDIVLEENRLGQGYDDTNLVYIVPARKGDIIRRTAETNFHFEVAQLYDDDGRLVQSQSYTDLDYSYDDVGKAYSDCSGYWYVWITIYTDGSPYQEDIVFSIERVGSSNSQNNTVLSSYSLYPITLADVELNKICPLGAYAYPGTSIEQLDNACSYDSNYCVLKHEVKKGDLVIFTNAHQMSGTEQKIAVMGKDGMLADVRAWSGMDSPSRHAAIWSTFASYYYEVPCDGTIYMSFVYTDVQAGEFFYIKSTHPSEPIVLYEYVDYSENSTMGDKVFKALMEGKNVLVRVENADGNNYAALYSPIYQYQVPNKLNNYLYLYYLKDTKQTLDLSAVGMGTIQLPIYNQIKLKVSHTYNHTPLI